MGTTLFKLKSSFPAIAAKRQVRGERKPAREIILAAAQQPLHGAAEQLEAERLGQQQSGREGLVDRLRIVSARHGEGNAALKKPARDRDRSLRAQAYVENGRVDGLLGERERARKVVGGTNNVMAEIGEPIAHRHGDDRFVVDNKNAGHVSIRAPPREYRRRL